MVNSKDIICGKCHVCKNQATNICSRCKMIMYCSEKCQKEDYEIHKIMCNKKCRTELYESINSNISKALEIIDEIEKDPEVNDQIGVKYYTLKGGPETTKRKLKRPPPSSRARKLREALTFHLEPIKRDLGMIESTLSASYENKEQLVKFVDIAYEKEVSNILTNKTEEEIDIINAGLNSCKDAVSNIEIARLESDFGDAIQKYENISTLSTMAVNNLATQSGENNALSIIGNSLKYTNHYLNLLKAAGPKIIGYINTTINKIVHPLVLGYDLVTSATKNAYHKIMESVARFATYCLASILSLWERETLPVELMEVEQLAINLVYALGYGITKIPQFVHDLSIRASGIAIDKVKEEIPDYINNICNKIQSCFGNLVSQCSNQLDKLADILKSTKPYLETVVKAAKELFSKFIIDPAYSGWSMLRLGIGWIWTWIKKGYNILYDYIFQYAFTLVIPTFQLILAKIRTTFGNLFEPNPELFIGVYIEDLLKMIQENWPEEFDKYQELSIALRKYQHAIIEIDQEIIKNEKIDSLTKFSTHVNAVSTTAANTTILLQATLWNKVSQINNPYIEEYLKNISIEAENYAQELEKSSRSSITTQYRYIVAAEQLIEVYKKYQFTIGVEHVGAREGDEKLKREVEELKEKMEKMEKKNEEEMRKQAEINKNILEILSKINGGIENLAKGKTIIEQSEEKSKGSWLTLRKITTLSSLFFSIAMTFWYHFGVQTKIANAVKEEIIRDADKNDGASMVMFANRGRIIYDQNKITPSEEQWKMLENLEKASYIKADDFNCALDKLKDSVGPEAVKITIDNMNKNTFEIMDVLENINEDIEKASSIFFWGKLSTLLRYDARMKRSNNQEYSRGLSWYDKWTYWTMKSYGADPYNIDYHIITNTQRYIDPLPTYRSGSHYYGNVMISLMKTLTSPYVIRIRAEISQPITGFAEYAPSLYPVANLFMIAVPYLSTLISTYLIGEGVLQFLFNFWKYFQSQIHGWDLGITVFWSIFRLALAFAIVYFVPIGYNYFVEIQNTAEFFRRHPRIITWFTWIMGAFFLWSKPMAFISLGMKGWSMATSMCSIM